MSVRKFYVQTQTTMRLHKHGLPMKSILFVMPMSSVGGGNVKILHYLSHAQSFGLKVGLWVTGDNGNVDWTPQEVSKIHIHTPTTLDTWDTIFFTWPLDWQKIENLTSRLLPEKKFIHIIQHIRHVNPDFLNGYALDLLKRKNFSRICVSPEVSKAIAPHVTNYSLTCTIPNVIDTKLFYPTNHRKTSPHKLKVLYANWKNTFGNQIRDHWKSMNTPHNITFESIDQLISQNTLADRMRNTDIFIGTPNPMEGFYLAPLEAMASAVAVICPDVIGNRSFCIPNVTCLMPTYNDIDEHIQALRKLVEHGKLRKKIAHNGYRQAQARQWWDERDDFLKFLQCL